MFVVPFGNVITINERKRKQQMTSVMNLKPAPTHCKCGEPVAWPKLGATYCLACAHAHQAESKRYRPADHAPADVCTCERELDLTGPCDHCRAKYRTSKPKSKSSAALSLGDSQQMRAGNVPVGDQAKTHTSQSERVFRILLNERQFPLAPGMQYEAPNVEDSEPVRQLRASSRATAERYWAYEREGKPSTRYVNGWPVEAKPVRPKPSDRRPESANVIWKTYVDDYMLVLVASPYMVQVTHEVDGAQVERWIEQTKYWVTQAEWQTISVADDQALADANARYFYRTTRDSKGEPTQVGVPLKYRSKKGWRVMEPFGECVGPYLLADRAEHDMRSWADELRVDNSFHPEAGWAEVVCSDGSDVEMAPELKARLLHERAKSVSK